MTLRRYTPCDGNRTLCLAPGGWYPEFGRRLGPPKGAATQSGVNGTVWRREFQGASVFVDLRNRSACSIVWKREGNSPDRLALGQRTVPSRRNEYT